MMLGYLSASGVRTLLYGTSAPLWRLFATPENALWINLVSLAIILAGLAYAMKALFFRRSSDDRWFESHQPVRWAHLLAVLPLATVPVWVRFISEASPVLFSLVPGVLALAVLATTDVRGKKLRTRMSETGRQRETRRLFWLRLVVVGVLAGVGAWEGGKTGLALAVFAVLSGVSGSYVRRSACEEFVRKVLGDLGTRRAIVCDGGVRRLLPAAGPEGGAAAGAEERAGAPGGAGGDRRRRGEARRAVNDVRRGGGETALVLGAGRSGRAAAALLEARGTRAVVLADDSREAVGGGAFAFAVASPGLAPAHPWIVEARRRGIPLKSELQLGCEELRRRGWRLLAVTGSKGKSSVVKVVADAINLAGGHAVACGNYGVPVSEVANSSDRAARQSGNSPWAVVEVSSFMMETTDLPADAFEAAAILNLQEDHLDRHGSVETYHGLKRKLLTFARQGFGPEATVLSPRLWAGSYFDNEILSGNAAIAVGLMRVAGLDDAAIAGAFRDFKPLPHRMNLVAEIGGVRYIDDSKATSLAALVAGVKMASSGNRAIKQSDDQTIRLIAGGLPKGDDPKTACSILTKRVKKVYLIGQCAEQFSQAWESAVDCEVCGTMKAAVEAARREAGKGDIVLLSPGTASFDQFKSFEERGEVFAGLVQKQGKRDE